MSLETLLPIILHYAPRVGGGALAGFMIGYVGRKIVKWLTIGFIIVYGVPTTILHLTGIVPITVQWQAIAHYLNLIPGATIYQALDANLSIFLPALFAGFIGIKKG